MEPKGETSGAPPDEDVIDDVEVGRLLGGTAKPLHKSTVQRLARDGRIPSFKVGWQRKYRRSSILAHIEKLERDEAARAKHRKAKALGIEVIK